MSLLSRLFGGGGSASAPEEEAAEPEVYEGFTILPEPIAEGGQYRLAARVEMEIDGEVRSHQIIRADTFTGRDEAVAASLAKARQVIDEQGTSLLR